MNTYIFVHGLSGWGSYDKAYRRMPYWGMRGGDLMEWLRGEGFPCYAASVAPAGSAWDRACELYAQLSGTRVDYGAAHSERHRHSRFGREFTPLIPGFDDSTRLVLLGHSFGGATIRVFAHLMQYGSARERKATPAEELSPLFAGGLGEQIHSLVALAAPHNGTSVYDMLEDPSFDPEAVKVPVWCHAATKMMSFATRPDRQDGRSRRDYADFDLRIDRADSLNRQLCIPPHAFCFSVPCSATEQDESGNYVPVRGGMEPLFVKRACQIGAYTGQTQGGIVLDESWKESDGLVNTISAKAPSHSPSKEFDPDKIEPGIWQTMPVFQGDHMSLQGGMFMKRDIRGYYKDLLTMIEGL